MNAVYSINSLGSFKCYISASSRILIKNSYFGSLEFFELNNALVSPDPEPAIINILYG